MPGPVAGGARTEPATPTLLEAVLSSLVLQLRMWWLATWCHVLWAPLVWGSVAAGHAWQHYRPEMDSGTISGTFGVIIHTFFLTPVFLIGVVILLLLPVGSRTSRIISLPLLSIFLCVVQVLWQLIISRGKSATRYYQENPATPEMIRERERIAYEECKCTPGPNIEWGAIFQVASGLMVHTFVTFFIPMTVGYVSLSSGRNALIVSMLVPFTQIILLVTLPYLGNEGVFEGKQHMFGVIQYPVKLITFIVPVTLNDSWVWVSYGLTALLERCIPRLVYLVQRIIIRRAAAARRRTTPNAEDDLDDAKSTSDAVPASTTRPLSPTLAAFFDADPAPGRSGDLELTTRTPGLAAARSVSILRPTGPGGGDGRGVELDSGTRSPPVFATVRTTGQGSGVGGKGDFELGTRSPPALATTRSVSALQPAAEPGSGGVKDFDSGTRSPRVLATTRSVSVLRPTTGHDTSPLRKPTKRTELHRHITSTIAEVTAHTDLQSTSRNHLAYANYVSTVAALAVALMPSPFDEFRTSVMYAPGHPYRVGGAAETLDIAWTRKLVLGGFFLMVELVLETAFVAVEAWWGGFPVGEGPVMTTILPFNAGMRLIYNTFSVYAGINQWYKFPPA
ncbi:hypothetical protein HDU96_009087 [Phlyctochytrium bullatum]|nr:hypothetical protein HDU96_009087 [Phlyctochytrium bullatum]